ncbi:MAG: SDR family oxidoreductase [Burkholderiaceae bacterium]
MNKIILTGHSYGLGAALAVELVSRGAHVMAISRTASAQTEASSVGSLQQVPLDLSDLTAVVDWLDSGALRDFLAGAEQAILINNAGRVEPIGPPGRQNPANIAQAVSLNVAAPLMLTDAFVAATQGLGDRRVLHISSGAARNAYAGWSIYCATKAALDQHAAGVVADNVAGLLIESLAPGVIDTAMQAQIRATTADRFPALERFEAMKKDGALASAQTSAAAIVSHLFSTRFGQETATDIRQI